MADDGGQFLVNNLKAGPYALIVQGRGYLESRVMAAGPEAGAANPRIALTRYAVIAGRVTDSEGYPEISTVVRTFAKGTTSSDWHSADERGEFRSGPLAPGVYYLAAKVDRGAGERVTYYPGVIDEASARPLTVVAGQVLRVELRTVPDGGVIVAGAITAPGGRPVAVCR